MKNTIHLSKIALMGIFALATPAAFAQGQAETTSKFHVHIEKEENGNKQVVDKTFGSKEEMEVYMKEGKLETTEVPEPGTTAAETPLVPFPPIPDPPAPKKPTSTGGPTRPGRKILIRENEGGNNEGKNTTDLQITATGLTSEERATIIQQLLDMKGLQVRVEATKTVTINKAIIEEDAAGEIEAMPGNISAVEVYPNPNSGQFHVEFNIEKPVNVTLRIIDIQGKEVYANTLNNYSGNFKQDISRSDLSHGTYIMDIQAGAEKRTTQVVMQ